MLFSQTEMNILQRISATIEKNKSADPAKSYVAQLHAAGLEKMLEKVAEESAETVTAARAGKRGEVVREAADLWFHTLVMLAYFDLGADDVLAELERREGTSGLAEKAARR